MKLLPPADFQLFEAHRLDKRAYLCRLLRRLEGGYTRFLAASKDRCCREKDGLAHACVELYNDNIIRSKNCSVRTTRLTRSRQECSWLQ